MVRDDIVYAEVFEILSCMKKEDVMKIPVELLEFFKEERSKTYKTRIDKKDLFNPDNIAQRTVDVLAWLMIDYIADEEEKAELIRVAKENDRKCEAKKKEKYSTEVFVKKEQQVKIPTNKIEDIVEDKSIVVADKKDSIFIQFINFFKNLFKIKG